MAHRMQRSLKKEGSNPTQMCMDGLISKNFSVRRRELNKSHSPVLRPKSISDYSFRDILTAQYQDSIW